jgi:hypothetical protein
MRPQQQPVYGYHQPPDDGSHFAPVPPVSGKHSSDVILSSFNYNPPYNPIPQSSSLVPSSAQYPPDTSQAPYASYPNPGFSDHQQAPHDYFAGSQHAFDSEVPSTNNPPYLTTSVSSAYTSSFPHQLSDLGQAPDYGAQAPLPTVTTPDAVPPSFPAFDTSFQTSTVSNKRPRSDEPEEDTEGVNAQMHGDALPLSAAEKLKRACTRCRGLKVCSSLLLVPSQQISFRLFMDRFAAASGTTVTRAIDVSRPAKSASFPVANKDDLRRTFSLAKADAGAIKLLSFQKA